MAESDDEDFAALFAASDGKRPRERRVAAGDVVRGRGGRLSAAPLQDHEARGRGPLRRRLAAAASRGGRLAAGSGGLVGFSRGRGRPELRTLSLHDALPMLPPCTFSTGSSAPTTS